jgi:excisionase family DNA binding protein
MPDYYSLEDVARKLGKSEDQVREMVGNGELRAFRDAGTLKFRKAEVDAIAPPSAAGAKPAGKEVEVEAAEPKQDELLFLIDEEGAAGDADDLTLIGETDEETAGGVQAGAGEEEAGGDEALTAVMDSSAVAGEAKRGGAEPEVDIFGETQAEAAAAEAEAAPVPASAVGARSERLRAMQEAAQQRSPAMSVLLVFAFLVLIFGGILVYNLFVEGPKPGFVQSIMDSVKVPVR